MYMYMYNYMYMQLHVHGIHESRCTCTCNCMKADVDVRNYMKADVHVHVQLNEMFCSEIHLQLVSYLNRSMVVPGGNNPWCCCHFKLWPNNANKRDGATTDTSPERAEQKNNVKQSRKDNVWWESWDTSKWCTVYTYCTLQSCINCCVELTTTLQVHVHVHVQFVRLQLQ